ncbi:MAG: hypothetical protein RL508_427 [Actinomycetota bacterium]|jgi:tRNA(fMet)-specific endonuclease VapC
MIMLDTNVCSYIIKGQSPWASRFTSGDTKEMAISAIVAYELELYKQRAAPDGALAQLIASFLRTIRIVPFEADAAAIAAASASALLDKERRIGAFDVLIAAHAMTERAVLVTNNGKDFMAIKGLNFATSL